MTDFSKEEPIIFDKTSHLGANLWEICRGTHGWNDDPKTISVLLYKRLWSNHRGFALLVNQARHLEADIILRSGVETAICIAANYYLREKFVALMKLDAAYTIQGQIKQNRDYGETELVKLGEETLRDMQTRLPENSKSARLNWKMLADEGRVPQLYGLYRLLSGVSSHVTGLSILDGVVSERQMQEKPPPKPTEKSRILLMACATLQGIMMHAAMIDETEIAKQASVLIREFEPLI